MRLLVAALVSFLAFPSFAQSASPPEDYPPTLEQMQGYFANTHCIYPDLGDWKLRRDDFKICAPIEGMTIARRTEGWRLTRPANDTLVATLVKPTSNGLVGQGRVSVRISKTEFSSSRSFNGVFTARLPGGSRDTISTELYGHSDILISILNMGPSELQRAVANFFDAVGLSNGGLGATCDSGAIGIRVFRPVIAGYEPFRFGGLVNGEYVFHNETHGEIALPVDRSQAQWDASDIQWEPLCSDGTTDYTILRNL